MKSLRSYEVDWKIKGAFTVEEIEEVWDGSSFGGAKGAFVYANKLVVLRRDEKPGLSWAGMIDLPGGARDGLESPRETLVREVREEVGLEIDPTRLFEGRSRLNEKGRTVWFFLCRISQEESTSLRLGDEGQACWMMPIEEFLGAPDAIPPLQNSVREVSRLR